MSKIGLSNFAFWGSSESGRDGKPSDTVISPQDQEEQRSLNFHPQSKQFSQKGLAYQEQLSKKKTITSKTKTSNSSLGEGIGERINVIA